MIAEQALHLSLEGIEKCSSGVSLDDFLDKEAKDLRLRPIVSSILFTYYRNKLSIEYFINSFISRKKVQRKLLDILSVTAVQLLFHSSISEQTAVNVAVEYTKRRSGKGAGGFVNAVLRRVAAEKSNIDSYLADSPDYVKLNIPDFVLKRWKGYHGVEATNQIASIIKKPEEKLFFRLLKNDVKLSFKTEKIDDFGFKNDFDFWFCNNFSRLINSSELRNGKIYIQDPATSMAISLIPELNFKSILDGCSAPGGKTLMLAGRFKNSEITAIDRSAKRLNRVRYNVKNSGANNIKTKHIDVINLVPDSKFDLVFLDVPCSNSGVLRKRPDVLWKLDAKYINSVVALQTEILNASKNYVLPGGYLVYSTCSIEQEENSGLIKQFLEDNPDYSLISENQLLPSENNDGAYGAVMKLGN